MYMPSVGVDILRKYAEEHVFEGRSAEEGRCAAFYIGLAAGDIRTEETE